MISIILSYWQKYTSTNIESINAKHSEIEAFMEELNLINFKFSLICFQECWLSENDDMCHLQLEGYQCIKQGKTCSNKGGLVMYLSKTFNYKVILSLNQYDNWEGQFIKVTGGGLSKDIIIGNIYRPPRDFNENYKQFVSEFTPIISSFDRTNSHVIIAGDFNINLLKINEKEVFAEFFYTLISYSFYPHIILPTRLSKNNGTLIDNFFCKLTKSTMKPKSGILTKQLSDHQPYFIFLNTVSHTESLSRYIKITVQNSDSISDFIHKVFSSNVYSKLDQSPNANPNVNYDILHDVMQCAKNKHMPYKTVKLKKYKHKKSTWITLGLLKSIRYRDKLYKTLKTTRPESSKYFAIRINLTTYTTILKKSIRTAKRIHYKSCFNKFKNNIKKTWETINGILSRTYRKKTFPNSFIYNENTIADKTAIANTFNSYFTNIGPNLANQIKNSTNKTFRFYLNGNHNNVFNFQLINEETISKTIDDMHTKASCGFYGISSRLLKLIKPVLTKSLTLITNQILTTGIFPDKLKTAQVIPIYKKGEDPYSATTGQYQSYLQFQK